MAMPIGLGESLDRSLIGSRGFLPQNQPKTLRAIRANAAYLQLIYLDFEGIYFAPANSMRL